VSPVISLENVTVVRGGRAIVDGISWSVSAGQRWVIMGPNGAGKTTLMQILSGYIHPTSGTARILGKTIGQTDVRELRISVGITSAATAAMLPSEETVLNTVITGAYGVTGRWREAYDEPDYERAENLIDNWGLRGLALRTIGTLSEGERKRVQIARALMADPELLLLDEPAAGLDVAGREDLVRRLSELAGDASSPVLVLVTHHVEEIPPNFTDAILLADGKVCSMGSVYDVVASEPMSAAFSTPLAVEFVEDRWYARGMTPSKARRARK